MKVKISEQWRKGLHAIVIPDLSTKDTTTCKKRFKQLPEARQAMHSCDRLGCVILELFSANTGGVLVF